MFSLGERKEQHGAGAALYDPSHDIVELPDAKSLPFTTREVEANGVPVGELAGQVALANPLCPDVVTLPAHVALRLETEQAEQAQILVTFVDGFVAGYNLKVEGDYALAVKTDAQPSPTQAAESGQAEGAVRSEANGQVVLLGA